QERGMKLAAAHGDRHHVVKLHLRHQRSHEVFRRIHNLEEIDSRFDAKVVEDRNRDLRGNVAGAASQAVERGIDEAGSATDCLNAVGDRELQVAVPMKAQSAIAAIAGGAYISPHILREHASSGIDAIDNLRSGSSAGFCLLAELSGCDAVGLHEVEAGLQA